MPLKLIDTHAHLQAGVFESDLDALVACARAQGLQSALICASSPDDWDAARDAAHRYGFGYLLGIHPFEARRTRPADLRALEARIDAALADTHFIGVGEIGLDRVVPLAGDAAAEAVFAAQLKMARDRSLPVSIHSRKAHDRILAGLKRFPAASGAVHAFNGSPEDARRFLAFGLRLGFGGSLTYSGSLRIRRTLARLPAGAWVLETDAPVMPGAGRRAAAESRGVPPRTEPADLADVGRDAAKPPPKNRPRRPARPFRACGVCLRTTTFSSAFEMPRRSEAVKLEASAAEDPRVAAAFGVFIRENLCRSINRSIASSSPSSAATCRASCPRCRPRSANAAARSRRFRKPPFTVSSR